MRWTTYIFLYQLINVEHPDLLVSMSSERSDSAAHCSVRLVGCL